MGRTEKNSLWHWDLNPVFQVYVPMLHPLSQNGFEFRCWIESFSVQFHLSAPLWCTVSQNMWQWYNVEHYVQKHIRYEWLSGRGPTEEGAILNHVRHCTTVTYSVTQCMRVGHLRGAERQDLNWEGFNPNRNLYLVWLSG